MAPSNTRASIAAAARSVSTRGNPPDWTQVQVATAADGPNKGLSYVLSVPGIPASRSHYGIDQNLLRTWKFAHVFGSLVTNARGTRESIRQQMILTIDAEWEKEAEFLYPMQVAFDGGDKPASVAALGCSIYLE